MKVTIRQVASAAGVSAMTVSSVLHGTGQNVRVSPETSERIRKIAADMNYQPNTLARSLRTRKTGMIGVVCQNLDRISEQNPYYPQLLNGIMAALFPENYTLGLCPSLVGGLDSPSIADGRFDGILWARPDFKESYMVTVQNSRIPVVMMHAPPGSASGISSFTADNDDAMRQAVDHLADQGHRRLSFVIDEFNEHSAEGKMRAEAFLKATTEAGVEGRVWVWDERMVSLENYLAQNRSQTALVAFSDCLAGHLLFFCIELGISVPRDLSVVGFDSSPFCERTTPKLTSIHQPVERMAFEATKHLISLIKQGESGAAPSVAVSSLYGCTLDVRESTASPASSMMKITHEEHL